MRGPRGRPTSVRCSNSPSNGGLRMRVKVMVFCLSAAISSSLAAQQAGQAAPAFRAENLYSLGSLDSVAVMQGGLSIQIPIASFGSEIRTSLQLVYQSSAWEALPQTCPPLNNCAQLYPKKQSRAGLGWRVSLGDLYQPSPGGARAPAALRLGFLRRRRACSLSHAPPRRSAGLRGSDPVNTSVREGDVHP